MDNEHEITPNEPAHLAPPANSVESGGNVERLEADLAASRSAQELAVQHLREALLAREPALDPSMVTGLTVEEVEASFAVAAAVLAKLRETVTRETAHRVPAGAPGRARFVPRTAFEKIREGLSRQP
jgi:hypothetical protein